MRTALMLAALIVIALPAAAASTWETAAAYPACVSESLYNEAWSALRRGDAAHFMALKGCILTKKGIRVGLIDRGPGWAKVRLIDTDGQSVVVYTHPSNIVATQ